MEYIAGTPGTSGLFQLTGAVASFIRRSLSKSNTGNRFTVATPAPVTMLSAPGPMEVVQAKVESRIAMFSECSRNMHHSLLMLRTVLVGTLHDSLAMHYYIVVTKNSLESIYEAVLLSIPLHTLLCNEADYRLTDREMVRLALKESVRLLRHLQRFYDIHCV